VNVRNDIVGMKFGKLTPTSELKRFGNITKRLCYCDCGNKHWVETSKITKGHTQSCGCLVKLFRKLDPGEAVSNQIFDSYKRGASNRGLVWELTREIFDLLIQGNCHYCDSSPATIRKARRMNGDLAYNGIDRLDPKQGYKLGNVVSCCKICNRAKSNMQVEDFYRWIECLINVWQ